MSLSENQITQANSYLENTLSETERRDFEIELTKNKTLQEYISINKEMEKQYSDIHWQFLEDQNTKEIKELENYLKSDDAKEIKNTIEITNSNYNKKAKPVKTIKLKLYSFIVVAASIILLIGFYISNGNQNLYNNYNSWEELPSLIERGATENNLLQNAENTFIKQNYSEANQLYTKYLSQNETTNYNIYLYLGITELELNQDKKALSTFNKIIESNSLDASKGYWYKALVYLKTKDSINAIKQLEIIVNNSENFKFAEAKKILEALKDD